MSITSRIMPIFAIAIALGIFFLYTEPTWKGSIETAKANIAADESALQTAQEFTARETDLASARDAIPAANLSRLQAFLPDSVNNVGLVLDLNNLAARSGLVLTKVDVDSSSQGSSGSGSSSKGSVGSVEMSLAASGTYTSLQTFLHGVETSERLMDVETLSVTGSNTGIYSYAITLRIYWLQS